MKGILGLLNVNQENISEKLFSSLSGPIPSPAWTRTMWTDKNVGFTCIQPNPRQSNVEIHLEATQDFVIVVWARLDNLQVLRKELGRSELDRTAQIILTAYQKWGKSCTTHLLGDWAFAVLDRNKQELFVARDQLGHTGIYYFYNRKIFIFSSSLYSILRHPGVPGDLNEKVLLQFDLFNKRDRTSLFKHIQEIPSGHSLSVGSEDVHMDNYWLPNISTPVRYTNAEDYVGHFLTVYQEAVSCRINTMGKTGITLSSGLDSTSTAQLAAEILDNNGNFLEAYSWAPHIVDQELSIPNKTFDESFLVKKYCDRIHNIRLHIVRNKKADYLDHIHLVDKIFAQPNKDSQSFTLIETLKSAFGTNTPVMLTGLFGNYTVSFTGLYARIFKDILEGRDVNRLIREIARWKKGHEISWIKAFYRYLYTPLFKYNLKKPGLAHTYPERTIFNQQTVKEYAPDALPPSRLEMLRQQAEVPLKQIFMLMNSGRMDTWGRWANGLGGEIRTPAMDIRLVEYCLNIPHHQFINHKSDKRLMRRSMKGKLPEFLLNNTKRGAQDGASLSKIRMDAQNIAHIIGQIEQSPLAQKWLNLDRLKSSFQFLVRNPALNLPTGRRDPGYAYHISMYHLTKGLELGLFFVKYEKR